MRRMLLTAGLAVGAALALTGCSQVAAIAPVSGTRLVEVRFATIDVLVEKGYAFAEVPACTQEEGGSISCTGSTDDGVAITAVSTAADPASVTVTVGDETVYDGDILEVLDRAARAS